MHSMNVNEYNEVKKVIKKLDIFFDKYREVLNTDDIKYFSLNGDEKIIIDELMEECDKYKYKFDPFNKVQHIKNRASMFLGIFRRISEKKVEFKLVDKALGSYHDLIMIALHN